jgi:hypothetical protein
LILNGYVNCQPKNHSSDYRQNLQHNTQIVPQKPLDTL